MPWATIQHAIDSVSASDTINVLAGSYTENVNVNKAVTLIGAGRDITTITANLSSDHVFEVSVNDVNISGFTATGATGSNKAGIYLGSGVEGCNIFNNNASGNFCGIYLVSSSSNTLTNNTANLNSSYGVSLSSSLSNTLTNNTANSNTRGIYLYSSSSSVLTGNTVSNSSIAIFDNETNSYASNQFLNNLDSNMITFVEIDREKNLNDTVSFDMSMFDVNGNACSDCSHSITTSPLEDINITKTANQLTGNFTVTKPGIYSLIAEITDGNNNITKRKLMFLVGSTANKTVNIKTQKILNFFMMTSFIY